MKIKHTYRKGRKHRPKETVTTAHMFRYFGETEDPNPARGADSFLAKRISLVQQRLNDQQHEEDVKEVWE